MCATNNTAVPSENAHTKNVEVLPPASVLKLYVNLEVFCTGTIGVVYTWNGYFMKRIHPIHYGIM